MQWKIISRFPEYEVSDHGFVRRVGKTRLLKTRLDKYGYEKIGIYRDGKQFFTTIHVLVASEFCDRPSVLHFHVAHFDGCKTNNVSSNLRWATPKQNVADSIRLGAITRGTRQHSNKLSEIQVLEIRSDTTSDSWELSKKYDISISHICAIKTGRAWSWLMPDECPPQTAKSISASKDKIRKSRNSSLTPDDVRAIRASHLGAGELAQTYNLSKSAIHSIRSLRSWRKVD